MNYHVSDIIKLIDENSNESKLHLPNETGGCMQHARLGLCQECLLLAKRFKENTSRTIVSSDSYFTMCAGTKSAQVKDFKHDTKNGSISDMSWMFCDSKLATTTRSILHDLGNDKVNLKLADYELFSKHASFKTRALKGSYLGCYVLKWCYQGVGAAKLNDAIQGTNDDNLHVDEKLIKFACKKFSTDTKVIEAYVKAMMHDPFDEMKKTWWLMWAMHFLVWKSYQSSSLHKRFYIPKR